MLCWDDGPLEAKRATTTTMIKSLYAVLGTFLALASGALGQNLVTDGTFTNPSNATYNNSTFSGGNAGTAGSGTTIGQWQFGTAQGAANTAPGTAQGTVAPSSITPGSGIKLSAPPKNNGTSNEESFVQQDLGSLAPGSYTLTFSFATATSNNSRLEVFMNGVSLGTFTNAAATFTTGTTTFTGVAGSNVLTFETDRVTAPAGSVAFDLNNVSVAATAPEPSSVITAMLVFVGICAVERRRIGGVWRGWAGRWMRVQE